jgi:hypothetical protein
MKVHLLCPSYCYKREICIDIFDRATSMLLLTNCKLLWATLRSSLSSVSQILRQSKKFFIRNHTKMLRWNLQMLSWKLHVRTSVSPRKSPFIVFITPSILNKNGGDRLRKMSISSIFEEEILENCWFWEVQTSGFGLCIIYPNYLSCFKVVPEPGQRNWTISCHRIRPSLI